MPKICSRYAQYMPKICPRYVQDMPKIYDHTVLTKCLPDKMSKPVRLKKMSHKSVLTKCLPDKTSKPVLTKCLLTLNSLMGFQYDIVTILATSPGPPVEEAQSI